MSRPPHEPSRDVRDEPPSYEPPAIAWEEAYEPVGFGLSCAKEEGNPGCFAGPIIT